GRVDGRADLHAGSLHALCRRANAALAHHASALLRAVHGAHAFAALGLLGCALALGVAAERDVRCRAVRTHAGTAEITALEVLAGVDLAAPGPARRAGTHETFRL